MTSAVPSVSMVRTTVEDILERDGQAVVLVDSQVMLLSHLAAQAALAARGGLTVAQLCDHLVAAFGPPPDGTEPLVHLETTLTELERVGVVERYRG